MNDALGIQRQIKQEAIKYVQQMPAGTPVTVLAMVFPGKIRLVQALTTDRALLTAAIDALEYNTVGPPDIQVPLDTLNQLAAVAAQIKGRKNLIWLTYGLVGMTDPIACLPCSEYVREFHRNVGLLTDEEVTLYPIEARGVYAIPDPMARAIQGGEELASLETMAEAGGGVAYYNSNDLATGIAQAVANGSDFYTLTYVPPGSGYDGRRHNISVQVTRPGVHLTYRTYYYAEDPAKLLPKAGLTLTSDSPLGQSRTTCMPPWATRWPPPPNSSSTSNSPPPPPPRAPRPRPSTGSPIPELKSKPLTRYDLLYSIPPDQITFTTAPGGARSGSVQFAVVVSDVYGKQITSITRTLQLPLSPDEYAQFVLSPFQFLQQIDLPAGQSYVRVGILDEASKKIGTLEISITVPKSKPAGAP